MFNSRTTVALTNSPKGELHIGGKVLIHGTKHHEGMKPPYNIL